MTLPPTTPDSASVRAALEEVADTGRLVARFAHPEKYPPVFRAAVTAPAIQAVAAQLAGLDDQAWRAHVDHLAQELAASARMLDAGRVARLPFVAGDRILLLGDSITDDLLSWGAHLQAYLDAHRGGDGIQVINAGITGNTTQEAIARIDIIIAARPTWVIQLLGTNDARLHGASRARMQSIGETRRNMKLLAELIEAETEATLVRLTPPPVIAADADAWGGFQDQLITWNTEDVEEIAEVVRQQPGRVIDLHARLSADLAADPGLMLPDGVHPSLAGQRRITEILLEALATETPTV